MANLNMGYPKRTGDTEKDMLYMYNFLCEMSDKLNYLIGQLNKGIAKAAESVETGEETEEVTE